MFSNLILYLFIFFVIFMIFIEFTNQSSSSSSLIEGLTTNASGGSGDSGADSSDNLGITVGRYTSKIDQLGKTIDSMQATILGLLPIVTKNSQDNAKNQQAIQAIIANKDKSWVNQTKPTTTTILYSITPQKTCQYLNHRAKPVLQFEGHHSHLHHHHRNRLGLALLYALQNFSYLFLPNVPEF